ncbi:NAD(P)/FAD-dependent oxidoreductase [Roseiconus nitratireducens]|uniref:NADH:ubiquinone reductase (non-electrogenic) n=1 Tax=Roseiconus nitratireducens TaxID=2605748 RepID=A0A5M6D554_9BACT|nr:NAD(P)/FAD-dependent oxidoreductase [Roseiconus nitratireducens]KAA5542647.1 NAD(P)/FAD-dependent oxidoreductase [Roseiconus nitratireducens]
MTQKKKVVVVGGGFAGMHAAKQLGKSRDCDVIIIDRRNHHLFQPLLYQVAMAGLDPSDIASPIRSMLNRYSNISTLLGEVTRIDTDKQIVHSDVGELPYDYLVVACGAMHHYFGHDEWEAFAPGLKNIPQATEIRRRVLMAFESAERTNDKRQQDCWLTFVLVGGGPTGVELAGAIAEMAKNTLKRDFKTIDASLARVIVVQSGDRILNQFPEPLSEYAKGALESLGVEVRLGDRVTHVDAQGVWLGDERIEAYTVIWAAGVKANPIGKTLGTETDRAGRVVVESDLSIPGHPEVFVIGDLAAAKDSQGNPLPGLAPVAMQEGSYVGKLIRQKASGDSSHTQKPFEYRDKGQMATIGRRRAVLQSGGMTMKGTLAWLGWLFVHIVYLNGFRNRMFVFFSWAWSYVTFARGARLIVPKTWQITGEESQVHPDAPLPVAAGGASSEGREPSAS